MDLLEGLTPLRSGSPGEKDKVGKKEEEAPHCATVSSLSKETVGLSSNSSHINRTVEVHSFSSCNGHQENDEERESLPDLQQSPRGSPSHQKPPAVSKKPLVASLPPCSPQKLNGRVASLEEEFRRSTEEELSRPSDKIPYNKEEFRPLEVDSPTKQRSNLAGEVPAEMKKNSSSPDLEICTNGYAHDGEDDQDEAEDGSSCSSESTDPKEDEAGESEELF